MDQQHELSRFYSEAENFLKYQDPIIKMRTVILDDWSGVRLVYETDDVRNCQNNCESCSTYLQLGEDHGDSGDFLRTTLVRSSIDHTDISENRMLNCKTKENYMRSFSEWLINRCHTESEFIDELVLIKNFQVVYSEWCSTTSELSEMKKKMTKKILESAKNGVHGSRREILETAVRKTFE